MRIDRRDWLQLVVAGVVSERLHAQSRATNLAPSNPPLKIVSLDVTPIALPDPPLLAASGCHGPYFLRNIVEVRTEAGIVGIGETHGGENVTRALERAKKLISGQNAFAYRKFARELQVLGMSVYAAIEMACLDACGAGNRAPLLRATRGSGARLRRVCCLSVLPVRGRSSGCLGRSPSGRIPWAGRPQSLDAWGEVRTPEAMADMAAGFRDRWGFRVFKLKGGVLAPDLERDTMKALALRLGRDALLRIDPNARWRVATAVRIGKEIGKLPLEYYEDPVQGQAAMAEVRRETGLKMSTNMCVTSFAHIPEALKLKPIDVLLCDHHYFGGFAGCQALGPICRAAGWSMSQHSNNHAGVTMAAMIHLGASIPELTLASDTHYPWLVDGTDIIEGPKLTIRGGHMQVPAGPGLGVILDHDKLGRAHETYVKCGMRGRDDRSLMRRIEPGWNGELL